MKRYKNVTQEDIFTSWNKLRDALLAAKNGSEVDEIIKALFTEEERFQFGRRILIAECLGQDMNLIDICALLQVGRSTVQHISRRLAKYEKGYALIASRGAKVEKEYQKRKYIKSGGSKLVFKKKTYSGIKRKDITR